MPKKFCNNSTKKQLQPLLWTQDKFHFVCKWEVPRMTHQMILANFKFSQNKMRKNTTLLKKQQMNRSTSKKKHQIQRFKSMFRKKSKKLWESRKVTFLQNQMTYLRKKFYRKEAATSSQIYKRNGRTHLCQMEWHQLQNKEDFNEHVWSLFI